MYAMWFYVGTLTGAFGFMDLGVGVAVGRFIGVAMGRNDHQAVREYWATGNAIVLPLIIFFAIVFVLIGCIWGPHWFKVTGPNVTTIRWAIGFSGLGLFFNYYGQMWNILAQAYLDFKYLSILRTWLGLASTLGILIVALLTKNIATICLYSTLLAALQFFLLFDRGNKEYQLPLKFTEFCRNRFIEILPYTMKTFAQLLSASIIGSLDRVMLGRLAPAGDFAAYGASQNIGGRVAGLSVAIMGPIFHNTTRGVGGDQSKKPADVYRESFDFMFPWYSLLIVGVFFWSEPITRLWLGHKYGHAVGQTFPWVVSGLSLAAIANISGAQLGALNRVGSGLVISTLSGLLSGVTVWIGWKTAGLAGASAGFFFAKLVFVMQDASVRHWVGLGIKGYLADVLIIVRQIVVVGSIWLIFKIFFQPEALVQSVGGVLSASLGGIIELWFLKRNFKTNSIE